MMNGSLQMAGDDKGLRPAASPMGIFDKLRQSALRRRSPLFSCSARILPNAD
jgi:hypothetical protein